MTWNQTRRAPPLLMNRQCRPPRKRKGRRSARLAKQQLQLLPPRLRLPHKKLPHKGLLRRLRGGRRRRGQQPLLPPPPLLLLPPPPPPPPLLLLLLEMPLLLQALVWPPHLQQH